MGKEIERKFLLKDESWRGLAQGVRYRQGYVATDGRATLRVRFAGGKGYLTLKGRVTGITRLEYEYEIPGKDALEILDSLCPRPQIEKVRFKIDFAGHTWEVDEFLGENEGLVMAEIELASPEEKFSLPPWIGQEVTGDVRYYNSQLAVAPFKSWKK